MAHRSIRPPVLFLLLATGLSACLPELEDDTAACTGPELCNGEDDDCDGQVDENAVDAPSWYPDADGDGYGDPSTVNLSCEQPTGFVSEDKASGENEDCDDSDAAINPGAQEIWYDDTDQDCSGGSDWDQDGDGHDFDGTTEGDCDDTDPDIFPGQVEVWYDGTDQDCDGSSDWDQDGDGHDSLELGKGPDCDDLDKETYPGATELWYDGVDQDCDGWSDFDQDYDGQDSDAHGGEDCDDASADVYAGATEVWYDGTDQDCSGGSDYDQDGDGWDYTGATGGDCDDTSVAIHPAALDWIDGDDNNCDGTLDLNLLADASVELTGIAGDDNAGTTVAGVGDVNGDGLDDILVGAPGSDDLYTNGGSAYLFFGPVSSGSMASADATFRGWDPGGLGAYAVTGLGDVNGDGQMDLALGSPWEGSASSVSYTGAVYLLHSPFSGTVDLDKGYDARWHAEAYDSGAGWFIDGGLDATDDGQPDLLLGATDVTGLAERGGAAYLVDGTLSGEHSLADAEGILYGSVANAFAGTAVAMIEDASGDGLAELLVGAPALDEDDGDGGTWNEIGWAFLFNDQINGSRDLADADGILHGQYTGDHAGDCVASAGDVNGDGKGDLLVGAPYAGNGASMGPGRVYLVLGLYEGSNNLLYEAAAVYEGPAGDDQAALCSASSVGDMDGDGKPEIMLGAYNTSLAPTGPGTVWVHSGTARGTVTTSDALLEIRGEANGDQAGFALAGAGDTNGDGFLDLLIGAPFHDQGGTDSGSAYLLLGSPLY